MFRVPKTVQYEPLSHGDEPVRDSSNIFREHIVDNMSRKKLVYNPEDDSYVARKQID